MVVTRLSADTQRDRILRTARVGARGVGARPSDGQGYSGHEVRRIRPAFCRMTSLARGWNADVAHGTEPAELSGQHDRRGVDA
jgi:hypothetical protein